MVHKQTKQNMSYNFNIDWTLLLWVVAFNTLFRSHFVQGR
jgi:hypothetical protein